MSAIKTVSVWGRGWVSDNDQTVSFESDGAITWTDGEGAQTVYWLRYSTAPGTPSYVTPTAEFSTMTVVAVSSGVPTSILEREADGTTRLFSVFESTSVLRLARLTDRNGNTVDFTREASGRLTRVTDVHGRYFALTYNAAGLVSQLADSGGRTSSYAYDSRSRQISESAPAGKTTYAYDTQDRLIKITYPNGGIHNYAYDAENRVRSEDDGNGNNALYYSYGPNSTVITDALGRKTVLEFVQQQGLKRLSKVTDPSGNVSSFSYDGEFNLSSETDALGRVTRYSHDSLGNVTEVQDPAGNATSAVYDPTFSQLLSITDPKSHTTRFGYDARGNNTDVSDPLFHVTRNAFDSMGHIIQTDDPLSQATHFTYDAMGALASVTDPLTRTTNLVNDALSRVTKNTDPAGHSNNYDYDAASNLTEVTDEAGNVTQYTYSPGRTGKLLTQVKDALGHTTAFGYNDVGRLTSVTNALNQTKTSQYDAKGNLVQTKNARGQVTTYTYDANDRLTKKSMVEGDITYTYDAAGNMLTAHHYNGSSLANTYDADNRLTQQIQTLPSGYAATLGYTYDAAGNRTRMTTPWGAFTYTYDAANRLTGITNPQNLSFTFEYDAAGRRTKLTYPNGIVTAYAYDAAGQVLSIVATRTADQVIVSSIAYAYDQSGNITTTVDHDGHHNFIYDSLNRLTTANHPQGSSFPSITEAFTYDAAGNRLTGPDSGSYSYNAANALTSSPYSTNDYDADGNITSASSTTSQAYSFDSQSRLTGISNSSVNLSLKEDALRNLVEQSDSQQAGSRVSYVYDGSNILAILDLPGSPLVVFTGTLSTDDVLSARSANASTYYHSDVVGSIRSVTNEQAIPIQTISYTAFGQAIAEHANTSLPPLLYSGRPSIAGLYNLRLRYYDPAIGRFISRDPIGVTGGTNEYLYARDNPIVGTDPLGALYILRYKGTYGHVAIVLNDGTYLSYQPVDDKRLTNTNDGAATFSTYLADETIYGPPAETVQVNGLDEAAIKRFYLQAQSQQRQFGLSSQYCTDFATEALQRGGLKVPAAQGILQRSTTSFLHRVQSTPR